jgi:hypothetical protein
VSVSHARVPSSADSAAVAGDRVPGLLEVLAQVPDPRRRRGRRYSLVFVLAVATVCALAGARNFREAGDQAADLPQEVLARLGGRPHPLRGRIIAPSEKRIRRCCRPWTRPRCLRSQSCLLEGRARTLSGPSPDPRPVRAVGGECRPLPYLAAWRVA